MCVSGVLAQASVREFGVEVWIPDLSTLLVEPEISLPPNTHCSVVEYLQ